MAFGSLEQVEVQMPELPIADHEEKEKDHEAQKVGLLK